MPIKLKSDVMERLKNAGYSSYRIRNEKIMGQDVLQKIRHGEVVSLSNVAIICNLLDCQPGDILEYVPDGKEI